MGTMLQIDSMSLAEKLATMERLWNDLASHAQDVAVPAWHNAVLEQREISLAEGTARFDDWEVAKENIRRSMK